MIHGEGGMTDIAEQRRSKSELKAAEQAAELAKVNADLRVEKERLEQQVAHLTAQLAETNQELEAFSYSVSHDLRAPLRAMAGFSRILIEEHGQILPDEARPYLELLQENALQMGDLVDALLALSRVGRQPLNKQPIDLAMLVQQVLDDLEPKRVGRRIQITIGDLPVCEADPALLKQVLVNLFSNAFKFTRSREVAIIEIGVRHDDAGRRVYFIKDNGAGFNMRYAGKLFGVFQRPHRADIYEGIGVGLAIAQRIIRRHGGNIWAEAEVGLGATFHFTLGQDSHD